MRLLAPALLASLLALGPVSCKRTTEGDTSGPSHTKRPHAPRPPGMPKPYRLPREPIAALHVDDISAALDTAAGLSGQNQRPRDMMAQALRAANLQFELQLLPHVRLRDPIDVAIVEGQTIVHVRLKPDGIAPVRQLLANKAPSGKFGAVDLARPPGMRGPKLAYLDEKAKTITLADDLRGLATGRDLAGAYGKKPLFVTVTKAEADKWGVVLPVQKVEIEGKHANHFDLVATGVPTDLPELNMVTDGALTGMLDFPQLAVGATSKYANYQQVVNETLADATREVNKQNFLVKGVLQDLLNRAKVVMRSWNGRVMLGTGPERHALIGLGMQDPQKAEDAMLHLIAGINSNLKTARSFGVSVPRLQLHRDWGNAGGVSIHALTLDRVYDQVPAEYKRIISPSGALEIAMAFSPRAGGAMIVIGPEPAPLLRQWLEANANATPGRESLGHTLAARVAVSPDALAPVLADPTGGAALNLNRNVKPTDVVAERRNDRIKLTVRGPADAWTGGAPGGNANRGGGKRGRPSNAGPRPRRTPPT